MRCVGVDNERPLRVLLEREPLRDIARTRAFQARFVPESRLLPRISAKIGPIVMARLRRSPLRHSVDEEADLGGPPGSTRLPNIGFLAKIRAGSAYLGRIPWPEDRFLAKVPNDPPDLGPAKHDPFIRLLPRTPARRSQLAQQTRASATQAGSRESRSASSRIASWNGSEQLCSCADPLVCRSGEHFGARLCRLEMPLVVEI